MMPLAFFEREPEPHVHAGDINDIVAMQLMCSRICHDLSGPAGAVAAAMEIIGDLDAPDPDALQLIAESSQVFRGRLSFLRTAFGFGGCGVAESSLAQIVGIATDSLRGGRSELEVVSDGPRPVDMGKARPADVTRLLLCLIWEASRGLPRGGRIEIGFQERGRELVCRLRIAGRGARFPEELVSGVNPAERGGLTSRNVTLYYLHKLLARLETTIDFRADGDNEATAVVLVPATPQ